ncbi:hypothetical protein PAPYR_10980 [Paratrimastix pyriformis]|uniref:Uncharacterized protein n=1 Tax=Paratrimastix pyriformis TaxID=342808 RepID=A0ABQ8U4S0_9EUKA|nr:hypothetical protein PAPYR_10980 [Paratrimastix pyriformis]
MQCMPDLRLKIVPSLQALNPSEFPELLPGFPGLRGTENAVPGLQALVLELNAPFKHTRSKILTHPLRPRLLRLLLRVLGLFQANPRTALLQAHYHHRRPHLGHCLPETENGAIEEMFGDDQADEPTAEQEAGEEQMDCSDEPGQLGAANSKAARRETAVNLFADDSQVGPVPAVLGSYTKEDAREMLLSRIEGIRKQRIGMAVKASELLAATPASAPTQGSLFTREELLEMEARVGLASQSQGEDLGEVARKKDEPRAPSSSTRGRSRSRKQLAPGNDRQDRGTRLE